MDRLRLLFICSRNQWRSPTAERVYGTRKGLDVRSAGVSRSARRRVTNADIEWADLIFVMEEEHKARLKQLFGGDLPEHVFVLDIPDEYQFMEPGLVEMITSAVDPILASYLTIGVGN